MNEQQYSIDTRTLRPGDIFIPIKGPNFDGHDFISEAMRKGASQIIDRPIGQLAKKYRKKLTCPIIAITGSSGKTTLKDMLVAILSQHYKVTATHENQNNEIGVPLTILNTDARTEILILELGMRQKGDLDFLTKIVRPTHVVITNIGKSHYEFFQSIKKIAQAKSEVLLKPLQSEGQRKAYLNISSNQYAFLEKKAKANQFMIYPFQGDTGIDQMMNICHLISQEFGVSSAQMREAISSFEGSSHRMNRFQVGGVTVIDDAYNSNPDGVRYALHFFKALSGRKLCVLGDMLELGEIAESEHANLEEAILDAGVSIVFAFGPLMKALQSDHIDVLHFEDKSSMHEALLAELKSGDRLLIKGSRGMKLEETVDAVSVFFK